MGKGSKRRPTLVQEAELERRWELLNWANHVAPPAVVDAAAPLPVPPPEPMQNACPFCGQDSATCPCGTLRGAGQQGQGAV